MREVVSPVVGDVPCPALAADQLAAPHRRQQVLQLLLGLDLVAESSIELLGDAFPCRAAGMGQKDAQDRQLQVHFCCQLWPLKQIKGDYGRFSEEAAGGPHSPRLGSYPVMEAGRRGPSVAERAARPKVDLSLK